MRPVSCNIILNKIEARAKERFGNKWILSLVKGYVAIAREQGDSNATVVSRRPQIERIFQRGTCSADSLLILAAVVGYKFQMVYVSEEIEELSA